MDYMPWCGRRVRIVSLSQDPGNPTPCAQYGILRASGNRTVQVQLDNGPSQLIARKEIIVFELAEN